MRDDIELLCEIINTHFGGLCSLIIRTLIINGRLPIDKLFYLLLKNRDSSKFLSKNSKNNFLDFRDSMLILVHHLCISTVEIIEPETNLENNGNSKTNLFEVNIDNIISRLHFPLYLNHVNKLLGENSKLILMEIIKHGRISTTVLTSELSENMDNFEWNLNLLFIYDFINVVNDKNDTKNKEKDNENNSKRKFSNAFNDLLFDYNDDYYQEDNNNLSNFSINDFQKGENMDDNQEKKLSIKKSNEYFSKTVQNKVVYINYTGLNNSINSQVFEDMIRNRYNNILSSLIVRVMSDSKGLKKKSNDQGWSIDDISSEIIDLLKLNPTLKTELDFEDESKLKNSILRVIDVLAKHSDEFISFNLSATGTIYRLNLSKIKYLVKYKVMFEYMSYRVGKLGSRVWSMMCNPHLLIKCDNIQYSEVDQNKSDNLNNSRFFNSYSKFDIKKRVYWDDVTLAEKCLLPNNVARNLLYSLSNERFIRIHNSDTITIDNNINSGDDSNIKNKSSNNTINSNNASNTNGVYNTISSSSLSKHGIFYSTCVESTNTEIQSKLCRILLNILIRCKIQNNQILRLEMKSKHLSQIELEYLDNLTIGLNSLFNNITQIDRILLILSN